MPPQPLRVRSNGEAVKRIGTLIFCLATATAVHAATPPHIEKVRIGLSDGPQTTRSRDGAWTPVQVTLKTGADNVTAGSFRLLVETTDGEAVPYRYTVPLPAIPANSEQTVFGYARPGSAASMFTVLLQTADGQDVQAMAELFRNSGSTKGEILEPRDIFYLTLGSRLHSLKSAVRPDKAPEGENEEEEVPVPGFAAIENVFDMPDRWFGYEGVDIIVLTTSKDAFVNQLLQLSQARREALLDWLRRGGKLVLSVGRNQPSVARWLEKMPLTDCALKSKITRSSLQRVRLWCGVEAVRKGPLKQVEIACVQPGPNSSVLVSEVREAGDLEERPIVLQSSYGLGRVLLVAFDLDEPPYSTWEGRSAFWKQLHAVLAPSAKIDSKRQAGQGGVPAAAWNRSAGMSGELGGDLKQTLETFEDVPVISFGWVALFILFYIVLVGPLDYFLLKKFFKRLELTWITFPVLVVIVSVAAYATAYYVKGDDLRINKVDLIDIDLHGPGQIHGVSWFTLFSPRIQNYTVGLEPAAPDWGGRWSESDADAPVPPVMVATWDGPEPGLGGGTQSLFRRPYEYAANAGGVVGLPIPVWATRSFTASWRVPLRDRQAKDRPPPIQAQLRSGRRDDRVLAGTITNNLPTELQGVTLFYRGKWLDLGDLLPGETREVSPFFERDVPKRDLTEWFSASKLTPRFSSIAVNRGRLGAGLGSHRPLESLLFHDLASDPRPNSGLRGLDVSWRLQPSGEGARQRYRKEAVLIGRAPPLSDRAEAATQNGVSPSRLWLERLPDSGARPALSGYLQQETYVRIFVPVQSTKPQPVGQP